MVADKSSLQIFLFGDLRVLRGDQTPVSLTSPRAQSLLAYMVLHAGLPQSRRRLAFELWPDSTEEQARSNLRKLLHDLRRALPEVDRYLEAAGPHLVWRTDVPFSLDVATFERHITQATAIADLQQAVDLYRGPLFPACYDDWILPERERLHQVWVDALERLMEQLENRGDYRSAIQYGQMLLQQDALHEEVYRHLMRLHALVDDRAAALRTYQTCAAVLKRELAVEPSPATQQLYERLTKLPTTPSHPTRTPAPSVPGTAPGPVMPLVGHRNEWQRLQEAWRAVGKGRPHWVALSGAAGIGKTRLADELLSWAAKQGIATANARAYRAESGLGYGALTSWLRARPLPSLDSVWLAELVRLLPELAVQHPELPAPGPLSEPWQRLRFFEAVARALLASQPLILLLDDIQYADADTLEWLHYAVRSNPQAALLIVSTLCWEEVSREHPLRPLFQSLRRNGQLNEIGVQPLNAEETTDLAQQVVGAELTPTERTALYRETEGNALYIVEVMRAGRQSIASPKLPRSVQGVMAGRLEQLDVETWGLAKVAAVIGRQFTVGLLSAASGVSESVLAHGLGELRDKRIVKAPQGERYDFDHSALREVLYAALNPAEKQSLHRRVAEALEATGGERMEEISGEIVEHFESAELWDRAVPYRIRAGDVARERYANATAIEHYRAALPRLPEAQRVEVMLNLGQVLELVGKWNEAESFYRQALELAERLTQTPAVARAQMALGEILHRKGMDGDALDWLQKAQRGFESLEDMPGTARVLESIGLVCELQGNYTRAREAHQQCLNIATKLNDPSQISRALGNVGWVHWRRGDYTQALAFCQQQLDRANALNDRLGASRALGRMGLIYHEQGDYARALETVNRRLEINRAIGDRLGESYALGDIGVIYAEQGDYARALDHYIQQLEIATDLGAPRGISHGIRHIGLLHYEQGDYARAIPFFEHSLQIALQVGDRRITASALGNLANAYSAALCYRESEKLYNQARALLRVLNIPSALAQVLYHQAHAYFRQSSFAKAQTLIAEATRIANEIGQSGVQFKIQLLALRLRAAATPSQRASVTVKLETLLEKSSGERERAALYYALWRLHPTNVPWRKAAARLYKQLHAQTAKATWRERYQELTSQRLKEPQPLPDLSAIATVEAIDLGDLQARVDKLIAEAKPRRTEEAETRIEIFA